MAKIESGSANVFADIGVADPEEMLAKAQLAAKMAEIIEARKLRQAEAAELVGLTQAKLSDVLRGKLRGVSEAKLHDCLRLLG